MIDFAFLADTMLKLLAALPTTLTLFFCSLVLGLTLSLGIVAMRVSRWAILSYPARFYIMIFRGTPLLIQMFLIYYGLGQFPAIRDSFAWVVLKSPYGCAVLSLAMCTAGYTAEIIRGGYLVFPTADRSGPGHRYVSVGAAVPDYCPGHAASGAAGILH